MFTPHTNRPNNNPIVIPSGSDSDGYSDSEISDMEVDPPRPQRTGMSSRFDAAPPSMRYRPSQPPYHTSLEQEKKVRSRLREERHAALSVLTDRELLTTQALAAQETLPQTRRRFLSKLMAPEDPAVATSLRADRFIIQHPTTSGLSTSSSSAAMGGRAAAAAAAAAGEGGGGHPSSLTSPRSGSGPSSSSTVPMIVQRSIVDVYEADDAGWRRPVEGSGTGGGGGGSGGSSGIGSPAGSGSGSGSRMKGKGTTRTPDRGDRSTRGPGSAGGGGGGGGRMKTPGSARRERERRRRWSGAERDERDRVASP